ncbi:MAG: polyphosphate kinase 1, partial [Elusimicrobia bacterium]|nr:polyphosphate kinase 1 [Elusimicrobiota bacterium]MBD3412232.1 polyphosphate kinase 1 [Elusimicrobiota bacterium]
MTEQTSNDPRTIYIHRDISWLMFNERVLEEALDSRTPLLERLKFLAICVNNLDEFFMVRIAALHRLIESDYNHRDKFGYYPHELYDELNRKTRAQIKQIYDAYNGKLSKELAKNKIYLKKYGELNTEQKRYLKRYFEANVYPIITPMAIDQGHPFPIMPSRTSAFAIQLSRYDKQNFAIIPIPKSISRVIKLPSEEHEHCFITLDELMRNNLEHFFKGYKIVASTIFRVIRDSELMFDDEYTPDMLKAMESELKKRPKARVVQLMIENTHASSIAENLCTSIEFAAGDLTYVDGPIDCTYLFELIPQIVSPSLQYDSYLPGKIPYENIFERIKEGDFIVHVPFQSFYSTVDLIKTAAHDTTVLAIKMTLYRTSEHSAVIESLKQAAKNNKQVTVLVEIKARFDEEKNITWAKELEESGCHVIYGITGMKIHSKMTLIVRKE